MSHRARTTALVAASTATLLVLPLGPLGPLAPAGAADGEAPGAPGAAATWRSGDKDGVGTSLGRTSKVWYTLTDGTLSETYYPAADTPNVRDLGFVVSDGSTSTQRETDGTTQRVELADPTSLTYRQTTTDDGGRWRITKTYVTDPARATVLMDVSFESLSGEPFSLYAVYDPSLAGTAAGDSGSGTGSGTGRPCSPPTPTWRAARSRAPWSARPASPPPRPATRGRATAGPTWRTTTTWTPRTAAPDRGTSCRPARSPPTDRRRTSPWHWASDRTPRPPARPPTAPWAPRSTPSPLPTSPSGPATWPGSRRPPTGSPATSPRSTTCP